MPESLLVPASKPFVVARAVTYATLFIGLIGIYLPGRVLSWSGVPQPAETNVAQVVGMILATIGGVIALCCVFAFAFLGEGTPAPFDPPRRLVIAGPYRFVRNPMYIGAGLALLGAALFYQSWWMAAYAAFFFLATHLFVTGYEEPTLRRAFGAEYESYCQKVNRWLPTKAAFNAVTL